MAEKNRRDGILGGRPEGEDLSEDRSLRPQSCQDFIGQEPILEQLRLFIQAARERGEALDHVLLYGPPGLGKTTLAQIVAHEMGGRFRSTSGPVIERKLDLSSLLQDLEAGDVLFIDEIHRLNRAVEEFLYPAMEDGQMEIQIGEGHFAKFIKIQLPPFTLVGATTRAGMVSAPLRTRFGMTHRLQFYSMAEMCRIVRRSADILGVVCEEDGLQEIARRSRGTPRISNRILRRVRDYAQVRSNGVITGAVADEAMNLLQIDHRGLDDVDRSYLRMLIEKFNGGPVGLNNLSVALSEDDDTIEDTIEPFLIQIGFLQRTPRGRVATALAFDHLGAPPPPAQSELF